MSKEEIKKALDEDFEEQKINANKRETLESARFWLDSGCWTKRGKRAYAHSIATSLLSIAESLKNLEDKR